MPIGCQCGKTLQHALFFHIFCIFIKRLHCIVKDWTRGGRWRFWRWLLALAWLICQIIRQLSNCQSNYLDVVKSQTLLF